jgi:hypothetical protein
MRQSGRKDATKPRQVQLAPTFRAAQDGAKHHELRALFDDLRMDKLRFSSTLTMRFIGSNARRNAVESNDKSKSAAAPALDALPVRYTHAEVDCRQSGSDLSAPEFSRRGA